MTNRFDRRQFLQTLSLAGAGLALNANGISAQGVDVQNEKRIGIIGLDTSHAVAFVKALNGEKAGNTWKGYKVVAAYPKGSNDIKTSVDRIPEFTNEVKKYNVEIVDSIKKLLEKVDFVLLETNDGRLHLNQALEVLKARKPMFIDKPIAASYKDAKAIFDASKKFNVPIFSSSSLRYINGMQDVKEGKIGKVLGATTYSPAKLEATHPDMFWYGIHGIEMLFTAMGPGCKKVSRVHTTDTDIIIGEWADGRVGTFRGTRTGKSAYGGVVFGEKANLTFGEFKGYDPLLVTIINFFDTKQIPVPQEETLEIAAFIEAADRSKKNNGTAVLLKDITG